MGWKNSPSGYESSWAEFSYDSSYEEKAKAERERLSAFIGKRFTLIVDRPYSNKAGEQFICSKVLPMAKYCITAIGNDGKEIDFKEKEIKWNL